MSASGAVNGGACDQVNREFEQEFGREPLYRPRIEAGHSLDETKTMARDVVTQAVRKRFKVVTDFIPHRCSASSPWPAFERARLAYLPNLAPSAQVQTVDGRPDCTKRPCNSNDRLLQPD